MILGLGLSICNPQRLWSPTDETDLLALYTRPNYNGTSGTWTATVGTDMPPTAGSVLNLVAYRGGPVATLFGPDFNSIRSTTAFNGMSGTATHHIAIAAELTNITSPAPGGIFLADGLISGGSRIAIGCWTDAGVYYATLCEVDNGTVSRRATVSLGSSVPTGITAFEGKKEGGKLWVRFNAGGWTEGDACAAITLSNSILQTPASNGANANMAAIAIYTAAKSDAFGVNFYNWARTL